MINQTKNAAKLLSQQAKIKKILAAVRAVGSSKNGKVRIVMNGEQKPVDVEVDLEIIRPEFQRVIQKSIQEAFEAAIKAVQEATMEAMKKGDGINDLMGLLQAGFGNGDDGTQLTDK
jgi:DNA-binding protein YbaB